MKKRNLVLFLRTREIHPNSYSPWFPNAICKLPWFVFSSQPVFQSMLNLYLTNVNRELFYIQRLTAQMKMIIRVEEIALCFNIAQNSLRSTLAPSPFPPPLLWLGKHCMHMRSKKISFPNGWFLLTVKVYSIKEKGSLIDTLNPEGTMKQTA